MHGRRCHDNQAPGRLLMPDLLDLTARQVRRDVESPLVHKLVRAEQHPDGRVYWARCGDVLSAASGAILTTREPDCGGCQSGGVRHG